MTARMDETRWLDDSEQESWRAYLRGSRYLEEALDRDLQEHGLQLTEYEILSMVSGVWTNLIAWIQTHLVGGFTTVL